jgi:DNA recombination protein RmuC
MQLDTAGVSALVHRIDGPSLVLGFFCGAVLLGFVLLLLHHRHRQRHLLLSLRLEQAAKNNRRLDEENARLNRDNNRLGEEHRHQERTIIELEAALHETRTIARERQQLFDRVRQQMEEDFRNLSRTVLTEQGQALREQHAGSIEQLLRPMREQLDGFKKRVEDVYDRESRDRVALAGEIERLQGLNRRIAEDAVNLTRALQGTNKLQGQWGEMVLEKLLEESGLRPDRDFTTQVALQDDDGRRRMPDVVIHLPGDRDIVVDAKMSLKEYVLACAAADEKQQAGHLKAHLASLRRHVSGLAGKKYQQLPGLTTVDFVLLFIPVEGAFQAAVGSDPDILTRAMRQRVIIAGPSTLLAVLRTIHHLWQMDAQKHNAITIAKEAGNLYDKFVGFLEAFNEVGTRLGQAQNSWQLAEKRLSTGRGNLIGRIEGLRELGIQPSRELPDTSKT